MKFFHPPNLYCVTTLPSKTNTTANIGANSWTGILQSQRYGGEDDSGAKVYSSYYCCIVLEKGLLPDIRAICQSLQVAIAAGWSASAHRPDNDGLPEKKEHINFIKPPNCPDINPEDYAIWGALQQRVYHQRQFETVKELKRAIVMHRVVLTAFHW